MNAIAATLRAGLGRRLPHRSDTRCCIAFSGGLDSTVLLDALAGLRAEMPQLGLRALHVNHGLQRSARDWADAAVAHCTDLAVPCEIVRVTVDPDSPLGLEAAAREARHASFRQNLRDGEVLVTAHHADDQLETVLLALVRGSGVRGLAAMPDFVSFGRGWHWRPLLAVTRAEIEVYARGRGLAWHEDPANVEPRHDRNYLRHEIAPQLRARWPQAAQAAVRSARHLGEAVGLLDALALADLKRAAVEECLDVDVLANLNPARQRQLLRYWLLGLGMRPPTSRRLEAMLHDLASAAADRVPQIDLDDGLSLRRHRGLVYPVRDVVRQPRIEQSLRLRSNASLELPDGSGYLEYTPLPMSPQAAEPAVAELEVRFRGTCQRVHLPGRSHSTSLKELMRTAGVLPWMRDRVPLVLVGGRLIAIGDAPLPGLPALEARIAAALRLACASRWRALR